MTDAAIERKAIELDRKLASLESELAAWLAASEEGARLEKHHSQIRAVQRSLATPIEAARQRLAAARDAGLLGQALELEMMIVHLHRVWDFFRVKLALRHVEHFELALLAAGELAWCCYEPAQRWLTDDSRREPPLVYFSNASGPLTSERGKSFQLGPAEDEPPIWALDLPVPVVGIPWFQVEHVPDAPIIAHEVGHNVEIDLGLADVVRDLIAAAVPGDAERRAVWDGWAGEVFADVYGALALGPAFATTLVDFLAGDPADLAAERGDGGDYPTAVLRIALVAAVLERSGFADAAEQVLADLRRRVTSHAMPDYEPDVPAVAAALVAGPYPQLGGGGLDRLITFPADSQARAEADRDRILKRIAPTATNARELIAAARLAFDRDPSKYVDGGAGRRVLERIRKTQGVGVRAGPRWREAADASPEALAQRDAAAGAALLKLLDETARSDGVQAQGR